MSGSTFATLVLLVVALVFVCPSLGRYMAAVFGGRPAPGDRLFDPIERRIYRFMRIDPDNEQTWTAYAFSMLAISLASMGALYALLRLQGSLPFNPNDVTGMRPTLALNTAASFLTGTNWQAYSGELQMSHLSQMCGLVVTQLLAGAVGIAVAVAFVRGLARTSTAIGNFWADVTRAVLRVLLPDRDPRSFRSCWARCRRAASVAG